MLKNHLHVAEAMNHSSSCGLHGRVAGFHMELLRHKCKPRAFSKLPQHKKTRWMILTTAHHKRESNPIKCTENRFQNQTSRIVKRHKKIQYPFTHVDLSFVNSEEAGPSDQNDNTEVLCDFSEHEMPNEIFIEERKQLSWTASICSCAFKPQ